MCDFYTAVTWLNHFDKSNMNDATRFLMEQFQEAGVHGNDSDQKANQAVAAAKASKNASALAEVMILIAEQRYQAVQYDLAWTGLKNAVTIYSSEQTSKESRASQHRLWVARWLCGWAGWERYMNYSAYALWCNAREDLEVLIQNSIDIKDSDMEKWYRNRRAEMDVELACRAEEVFTWLYKFPTQNVKIMYSSEKNTNNTLNSDENSYTHGNVMSQMGSDLVNLRDKIVNEVKRVEQIKASGGESDYSVVTHCIQDILYMLPLRSDFNERAEALLECGLAMHQIQDHPAAAYCLERAISDFPPGSHQKTVVRWMLGIIMCQIDGGSIRAFNSLRKAIDEMEELRRRAGIANNKPVVDWYTNKLEILEKAMARIRDQA